MQIRERSDIRKDDIEGLLNGDLLAVRIGAYCSSEQAEVISTLLCNSRLHGAYENAPAIGRTGQAFFESQASDETANRYLQNAVPWIRELRDALHPNLSPIDRVRLELDEVWSPGARLATMAGHKMFAGLARTFATGSHAEPHQDIWWWDCPSSPEARRVKTQLAMNVYLTMPARGGELTLWPDSYDAEGYARRKVPGSYGLRREVLPEPAAKLVPRVGELILFNANKVHAVEPIEEGDRVTWSCFIGYEDDRAPLVIWS